MTASSDRSVPAPSPTSRTLGLGWLLLVAGAALAVRALHFAALHADDWQGARFFDSALYTSALEGGSTTAGSAWHTAPFSVLYSPVLALFRDSSGALDMQAVLGLQAALGVLSALLAALCAARIAGRAAGVIAGLGAASFAPLIHFELSLTPVAWQAVCVTASFACLVLGRARWWSSLGAGLALGCASLFHASSLALLPGTWIAAWLVARDVDTPARRALQVGLTIVGSLALLPLALSRSASEREPGWLGASGVMAYIGNHAGAHGTFRAPPGYDMLSDPAGRELAERALAHKTGTREASEWWWEQTRADVQADLPGFGRLLARKLALALHPREVPLFDDEARARSGTFALPIDTLLVLLLALAAPFFVRGEEGAGEARVFVSAGWLVLLAQLAALTTFFVAARFRAPILPLALVLAGCTLASALRGTWRGARIAAWCVLVLVYVAASGLYRGPLALETTDVEAERQRAAKLVTEGRMEEGVEAYRRAMDVRPTHALRTELANALRKWKHTDEAEAEYRAVIASAPRDGIAWYNLANLLRVERRDLRAAEAAYRYAVELTPDVPELHYNLGALLLDLDRPEDALAEFEACLSLAPANAFWRSEAERARALAEARASLKK